MFGQIKKILGIEGVKIDIDVPQPISSRSQVINGMVKLSTMTESTIESISIKMIEKYTRGRGNSKLINDYVIGYIELDEKIYLKKNDVAEVPFELPFILHQSEMDKIERSNFITGGIVKLAKLAKGVKSEYRLEAEAIVTGTKLNPVCTKEILMN